MAKRDPAASVPDWALAANYGMDGIVTWNRRRLMVAFAVWMAGLGAWFGAGAQTAPQPAWPMLIVLALLVAAAGIALSARKVIRPAREVPDAEA